MKYRPILFSGEMIRALLREENPKTQTRRIIKKNIYTSDRNPPSFGDTKTGDIFVCPDYLPTTSDHGNVLVECEAPGVYHNMGTKNFAEKHCPYGVVGDRLWVRESTVVHASIREQLVGYVADGCKATEHWEKTMPSIHMRKAHCRIALEITDVRVERLNSISAADAIAEGLVKLPATGRYVVAKGDQYFGNASSNPVEAYSWLWERINGENSWKLNPFVWALTFKRV